MKQNDFEAYKKAVKLRYEEEKNGNYSSFLWQPSRANLRKLCVERLKENPSSDDLNSFKIFIGFEFKPENSNKLKDETDRFRTIENFLKGSSDSNDVEVINLAAILVDFTPRPYLKFVKSCKDEIDTIGVNFLEKEEPKTVKTPPVLPEKNLSTKKKLIIGLLGFTALFSIGYTAKDLVLPTKECMQWQSDHYVLVDCQSENNGLFASSPIIPYDENAVALHKLMVCDTTTFFEGGKAIIWYCKVGRLPEFFDGPGLHPITGKALRPVTNYIIGKYVKK
ncbi:hypothetical protein [Flavobacterium sp. N1994]|uniref:hypothetical protein n=1 Tax=Flavobacterium sp. N1994 TaxID=2986827 RepID=UPI0022220D88|nr:hypothetical protein [Flavobacterium sp. N1994]